MQRKKALENLQKELAEQRTVIYQQTKRQSWVDFLREESMIGNSEALSILKNKVVKSLYNEDYFGVENAKSVTINDRLKLVTKNEILCR